MTSRTLYTIGYEKTLLKDVLASLAAAGVATLLDVRDRPISRRPGFSKRQLAAGVEEETGPHPHSGRQMPAFAASRTFCVAPTILRHSHESRVVCHLFGLTAR